ncbi:SWIB/MDM2 domain-containing protein [Cardiosporidium cionae]|uniref:SWIB/MDM2 domain-containing protein n=1 Tax=Cardiosporidium cionae TaxID=476202 RepID=A0ABQ7JEW6_9APIC|nr:SWIB/MDM2 domain-containing protein [Cardiosporidium cionae]|eukprot:KAF8822556.1 SWIB/MDM2 domain-containing protein [Cardiosporidium cionae]
MKQEKASRSVIKTATDEKSVPTTLSMGSRTSGKQGRVERQEILRRLKQNFSNSKLTGNASHRSTQVQSSKLYSHVSPSNIKLGKVKPLRPSATTASSSSRCVTKKRKKRKRKTSRRGPDLRREAASRTMHQEIPLSKELKEIVGVDKLSRPGVIKAIWLYVKTNKLADPMNGRQIVCDAKLSALFPNHPTVKGSDTEMTLDRLIMAGPDSNSKSSVFFGKNILYSPPTLADLALRLEEIERTGCTLYFCIPLSNTVEMAYRNGQLHFRIAVEPIEIEDETLPSSSTMPYSFPSISKREEEDTPSLRLSSRNLDNGNTSSTSPNIFQGLRSFLYPSVCLARNALQSEENLFRLQGSLHVKDLSPLYGYNLTLQAIKGDLNGEASSVFDIGFIELSQRSDITRWSVDAVCTYIQSLHIPEFEATCRMHSIDGRTIAAFTECDYLAYGLPAPFLVKRIMDGLRSLK